MKNASADLNALLERVKAAMGPDRDLDAAILCALPPFGVNWKPDDRWQGRANFEHSIGDGDSRQAATFTASIGSALALVGRCLPGWRHDIHSPRFGRPFEAVLMDGDSASRRIVVGTGATAPIAILSALLSTIDNERGA